MLLMPYLLRLQNWEQVNSMRKLLNLLASKIAFKEGKKSQVKIGDIREILSLLKKEIKQDPSLLKYLVE